MLFRSMLERLMAADLGIPVNRSGDEMTKDIDTVIEAMKYMERMERMKAEVNDPSGGAPDD